MKINLPGPLRDSTIKLQSPSGWYGRTVTVPQCKSVSKGTSARVSGKIQNGQGSDVQVREPTQTQRPLTFSKND